MKVKQPTQQEKDLKLARLLKVRMLKEKMVKPQATLKDLMVMINSQRTKNYEPNKKMKLYNLHSCEYCEYLSLLLDYKF